MSDWFDDSLDQSDDDAATADVDELFEWDDGNRHKLDDHRLTEDEVQEACLDPERKLASAYSVGTERRRALVGATTRDRILFVVYTVRAGRIRVISARYANAAEQRRYWR